MRTTAELAGDKPWFAIGGIDAGRLPDVLDAGARRIVVVRAITAAEDPRAASQAAQFGTCSSELIRELSSDGA